MKGTFFRDVNYGFWYHLECSGRKANILSHQGIILGGRQRIKKHCHTVKHYIRVDMSLSLNSPGNDVLKDE